ncbi:MAG: hypothetical protein JWQ09_441 [Segetibacter sp.]|nr:hypothetical protein [Segetibacter sp.]
MGVEIERKYLVNKKMWDNTPKDDSYQVRQGYILNEENKTIRIRLTDNKGYITIKGASKGSSRPEFEYPIPIEDAEELLKSFCTQYISKIRHNITYKNKLWEVDEFLDDNAGLIIAEIELKSEGETFDLPGWVEKEVTGDAKYYNSNLSLHPFKNWKQ